MNQPMSHPHHNAQRSASLPLPTQSSPRLSSPGPVGVILALAAAFSVGVAPARAQFQKKPAPPPPKYGSNVYVGPTYTTGPQGAAGVISAQGKLMTDTQQAYLQQEQVKQAKVDTKRKSFDEWQYEQARTPSKEETREKERKEQLQRSRNDPPQTEIWSAKALNDILGDLQRMQGTSAYARSVVLDSKTLERINVSTGKTGGVGLLRDAGKLPWPLALQDATFSSDRKQVDQLVVKAVSQAKGNAVQAETLRALIAVVGKMNTDLKQRVADISTTQYMDARRFMDQLEESTRVLQEPRAANYFNGAWVAKGSTVADLTRHMSSQGLKFAPATAGDEASYTALHRSMATYDTALNSQAPKQTAKK